MKLKKSSPLNITRWNVSMMSWFSLLSIVSTKKKRKRKFGGSKSTSNGTFSIKKLFSHKWKCSWSSSFPIIVLCTQPVLNVYSSGSHVRYYYQICSHQMQKRLFVFLLRAPDTRNKKIQPIQWTPIIIINTDTKYSASLTSYIIAIRSKLSWTFNSLIILKERD